MMAFWGPGLSQIEFYCSMALLAVSLGGIVGYALGEIFDR